MSDALHAEVPPLPSLMRARRVEDGVFTIINLTRSRFEQVLQTWALCKGSLHSQATLLLAVLARFNSGAFPRPINTFPALYHHRAALQLTLP
jgi:hypothetical protein